MDKELPLAEEMNYFKTSKAGVETWLDKTEKLIEQIGGVIDTRLIGKSNKKEAILFTFTIENIPYRITWPILPTKKDIDRLAAQRQAATMVYHDVKNRIVKIKIFSITSVFSDFLLLNNNTTLAEIDQKETLLLLNK